MRIVTRPDFDGVICAVLLLQAENIDDDILWVEPNEIQKGKVNIFKKDIVANLPFSSDCGLWFDHHISNRPEHSFKGAFAVAPSAARVIYEYYKKRQQIDERFDELVLHADIIDAADLDIDQVRYPENYPYILLSMTIQNHGYGDIEYWNRLVDFLTQKDIDTVIAEPDVKKRCSRVITENQYFEKVLLANTRVINGISITDFRHFDEVPEGNRFLIYSLFPDTIASVKLRFDSAEHKNVQISIGHNIFQKNRCHVNMGTLLSQFGGGGHFGAGGCTLSSKTADKDIDDILSLLFQNNKEDQTDEVYTDN